MLNKPAFSKQIQHNDDMDHYVLSYTKNEEDSGWSAKADGKCLKTKDGRSAQWIFFSHIVADIFYKCKIMYGAPQGMFI